MSIFEPIPREPRWDDADTQRLDEVVSDDESIPDSGSLDPRSIKIAGASVAAIVIAGLVASNMAEPDARPERLVPARVEPGAAAVEQAEAKQVVPTAGPSASPAVEPADEAPLRQGSDDSDDGSRWSGDGKWDNKPGKGKGRGWR